MNPKATISSLLQKALDCLMQPPQLFSMFPKRTVPRLEGIRPSISTDGRRVAEPHVRLEIREILPNFSTALPPPPVCPAI